MNQKKINIFLFLISFFAINCKAETIKLSQNLEIDNSNSSLEYWQLKQKELGNLHSVYLDKILNQDQITRYGINAKINQTGFNLLSKQFDLETPACPCLVDYGKSSKSGLGIGFDFIGEKEIAKSFALYLNLGFWSAKGTYTSPEKITYSDNGTAKSGFINHNLDNSIGIFSTGLGLGYRILPEFSINLGLGADFIISNTYNYNETLDAAGYYFDPITKSTTRDVRTGTLKNTNSMLLNLYGTLNYEIAINNDKTSFIVPNIHYKQFFSKISNDLNYSITQISFGLALKFSNSLEKDTLNYEQYQRDSIKIAARISQLQSPSLHKEPIANSTNEKVKESKLHISFNGLFAENDGRQIPINELQMNEYLFTGAKPFLNMVFFDENHFDLPERYQRLSESQVKEFDLDAYLYKTDIEFYYQILNVIGYRMKSNPKARIKLIGCNADTLSETGNISLSEKRALTVKNYLTSSWQIEEKRINIEKRNLPKNPTKTNDPRGIEENRRVEIEGDEQVLEPLFSLHKALVEVVPQKIKAKYSISTDENIIESKLIISDEGNYNKTFTVNNITPKTEIQNDIDFSNVLRSTAINGNLKINIQVNPTLANKVELNPQIVLPIQKKTIEQKREKNELDEELYSFTILLPFTESGMSGNNLKIVNYANKQLQNKDVKLSLTGMTDDIGTEAYNLDLAKNRISRVLELLKNEKIEQKPIGVSNKYDNKFPEGRFFNRSVIIETKIKNNN